MAKKKSKDKSENKRGLLSPQTILIFVLIITIFSPGHFALIFLGMMPTLMMYILERGVGQQTKTCILTMNTAALIPYIAILTQRGSGVQAAFNILTDFVFWIIISLSPVIALFLLWLAAQVAKAVIDVFARKKIEQLRGRQVEVIEEFGRVVVEDAHKAFGNMGADTTGPPSDVS